MIISGWLGREGAVNGNLPGPLSASPGADLSPAPLPKPRPQRSGPRGPPALPGGWPWICCPGDLLTTLPLLSPQTHSQDIEKLKSQYRNLARDSAQAKRKYQEASKGVWLPSDLSMGARGGGDGGLPGPLCRHPHALPLTWQTRTATRPRTSTCAACGSSSLITIAMCLACGLRSCTISTTTSSCCPACSSRCRTCTRRWHASCEPRAPAPARHSPITLPACPEAGAREVSPVPVMIVESRGNGPWAEDWSHSVYI